MSLIVAWVLFSLVLGLLGAGWGFLVERLSGRSLDDALLIPVGLASVLVAAGTLNAFTLTAPVAVPLAASIAIAGLPFAWAGRKRLGGWPLLAALGTLFAFGAPVVLSGDATFAGFVKLDDTAVWFNIVDHFKTGPHAAPGEELSTYSQEYNDALGPHYPRGSFVLPAVAHTLLGVDVAWVFQAYLAACGAGVALCLFALIRPLIASSATRALIAFLAAQSALLYGYSLWGGIKELTAAFALALMAALAAAALRERPRRWRALIPLAIATAALIQTLGVGAAAWVALMLAPLVVVWLVQAWRAKERLAAVLSIAALGVFAAALIVPVWIALGDFVSSDSGLFSSGQDEQTKLGNLNDPLSPFQLAGIWPVGDFRATPDQLPTIILVGLVILAALGAFWACRKRGEWGLLLYPAAALGGCGAIYLAGATPWVIGKTLAIASPALLLAALVGAAMLWKRHRAGIVVLAALAFGVLWSTALAYHDAVLAPRDRLAELERIGEIVAGEAPTFLNEYEIYGDYHFLREGAPVGPADYRPVSLPLSNGVTLTKSAWADIDSFPLSTLLPYRSIVTRHIPAESRPPSIYELVWQGDYYELWQRPDGETHPIVEHIPYGESLELPYCGTAEDGTVQPKCSVNPAASPSCPELQDIAERARSMDADLLAHQRAEAIVARGDQTVWPAPWFHDPAGGTLTPNTPGEAVSQIGVGNTQIYELWLGGSFARGFDVTADGEELGRIENEQSTIGGYAFVDDLILEEGVHKFKLDYPSAGLGPGSGNNLYTLLTAISLQPVDPPSELIRVPPGEVEELCGRPLDWIEIVERNS